MSDGDAGTNGVLCRSRRGRRRGGGIDREGDGIIGIGPVEIVVACGIGKFRTGNRDHTIGGAVVGGGERGGVNGAGDGGSVGK